MLRAKKQFGQNFLQDTQILRAIADAIPITSRHIVEIGPGYGALTEEILARNPGHLDLVEIDPDMTKILREWLHDEKNKNITLYEQDVLTFIPERRDGFPMYSVIGNIPYYITSPIFTHFFYTLEYAPSTMIILMQKEVGEKILAGAKKKRKSSYFSLLLEYRTSHIWKVIDVPRNAFSPAPKVDSIVLGFTLKTERDLSREILLQNLWREAFAQPRKTFLSNLRSRFSPQILEKWVESRGYDLTVRSERLTLQDWEDLLSFSQENTVFPSESI